MDSNHYTSGAFGLVQRHIDHTTMLTFFHAEHFTYLEAKTLAGHNWTTL